MFTTEELKKINNKLEKIETQTNGGIDNILEFDKNISNELKKFITEKINMEIFLLISVLTNEVVKNKEEATEKIDMKILLLISALTNKELNKIFILMQNNEFKKIPVLDKVLKFKIDFFSDTIYDAVGIKNVQLKDGTMTILPKENANSEQIDRINKVNEEIIKLNSK